MNIGILIIIIAIFISLLFIKVRRKPFSFSKRLRNYAFHHNITLIAAVDEKWGIAKDGKIPWHIKEDLQHFRKITSNNVVVMGRKTFESIGKPLKNRINIVITKNYNFDFHKPNYPYTFVIVNSIEEALQQAKTYNREIFIIGGEQIYNKTLPYCDAAIITQICGISFDCDKKFPDLDNKENWIKYITKITDYHYWSPLNIKYPVIYKYYLNTDYYDIKDIGGESNEYS